MGICVPAGVIVQCGYLGCSGRVESRNSWDEIVEKISWNFTMEAVDAFYMTRQISPPIRSQAGSALTVCIVPLSVKLRFRNIRGTSKLPNIVQWPYAVSSSAFPARPIAELSD